MFSPRLLREIGRRRQVGHKVDDNKVDDNFGKDNSYKNYEDDDDHDDHDDADAGWQLPGKPGAAPWLEQRIWQIDKLTIRYKTRYQIWLQDEQAPWLEQNAFSPSSFMINNAIFPIKAIKIWAPLPPPLSVHVDIF